MWPSFVFSFFCFHQPKDDQSDGDSHDYDSSDVFLDLDVSAAAPGGSDIDGLSMAFM